MVQLTAAAAEIPAFYSGRAIFITGGSGFLGKVLIERLLTTCPDISKLYILLREKKGIPPQKRLDQLQQCQAFDVLRASNPKQLDKIEVVPGDITKPMLGLTAAAQAQLRNVSVVFHSAALVKLIENLKTSVEQNLRPMLGLLEFTDSLPNLEAFIHVSTAYCNGELRHIEEKVYPPPMELEALLRLVEDQTFDEREEAKYVGKKPNTYTFAKAVAEHVLQERGCSKYPIAIVRPTIVISSLLHPHPGWMDNLNGPSGVVAGCSTGLLRVFRAREDARADVIPVDMVADTLIAVAWETALDRLPSIRVYNCSTYENPTTWFAFTTAVNETVPQYPQSGVIMYPHLQLIQNKYLYYTVNTIFQTIPLYLLEYVKKVLRLKGLPNFIKIQAKFHLMNQAAKFFVLREWRFDTDNVVELRNRLSDGDRKLFNIDVNTIHWHDQWATFIMGSRKYVLKEQDHSLSKARRRVRNLGFLQTVIKVLGTLFILYLSVHWSSILSIIIIFVMLLFLKQYHNIKGVELKNVN